MSAIPQGAFATVKIKQNLMKSKEIKLNRADKEVNYRSLFLSNDSSK